MGQEDINQKFRTSIEDGKPTLTREEILKELNNNCFIHLDLKKHGAIGNNKYLFITKNTFSTFAKEHKKKYIAEQNLKVVEDYINSNQRIKVKIAFAEGKNNKLALYDANKFDDDCKLENKLREIFY